MNEQARPHDIIIKSRANMELCGVLNVISFDEQSVCLETSMGEMVIDGENLHVSALDTDRGTITLDGKINGLYYSTDSAEGKKGLFGRIFS